ncbi:carboxypeptidase-like regulatory domain-containing protein [Calycomorphotria hydatis]|uniref:Carboxypeptidase regulatory-like domain-containing protein n=1 Tax=Calycomorphotria hydatis TaxID=2528027 RepID=A0A517T9T4_9PLAN|nr:carboxypeptidase-like regulatory domain-containing protein [Calycomorphotria hydatis]QDT65132.1 hypothetical protein V22_23790 [Calycomorphotria hydatis]
MYFFKEAAPKDSLSLSRSSFLACTAIVVSLLCGCGQQSVPIANVSGTVTLNGEPLPMAHVTFVPQGKGHPSHATTDNDGNYSLVYKTTSGAVVGDHTVLISAVDAEVQDGVERVPYCYNRDSELSVTVENSTNKIDFSLVGEPPAGRASSTRPDEV